METRVIVGPPSTGFGLWNLLSLATVYAKVASGLYLKWWQALVPSIGFLSYLLIRIVFFFIFALRSKGPWRRLELRLTLLWKISQMIMLLSAIFVLVYFANAMQTIDDAENPETQTLQLEPLFIPIAVILFTYTIYSWLHERFSQHFESSEDDEHQKPSENISVFRMVQNSILSILGNSTMICAGGACNNIYISTISAFFSAFGIPIVEYIHYLSFIAFFFVGISLVSLYSVKKSCFYPPFVINVLGSASIVADLIFSIHDYLTYVGNVFLICGAIWNARLDKFSFAAAKKRKAGLGAGSLPVHNHLA